MAAEACGEVEAIVSPRRMVATPVATSRRMVPVVTAARGSAATGSGCGSHFSSEVSLHLLDAFTHLSERGATVGELAVSLCAILVGDACNIGLAPLVTQELFRRLQDGVNPDLEIANLSGKGRLEITLTIGFLSASEGIIEAGGMIGIATAARTVLASRICPCAKPT